MLSWWGHRGPAHHRWRHGGGGLHRGLRRANRDGAAPGAAGTREALPLCEQGLGCVFLIFFFGEVEWEISQTLTHRSRLLEKSQKKQSLCGRSSGLCHDLKWGWGGGFWILIILMVILMGFQEKWWYKMGVGRWGWWWWLFTNKLEDGMGLGWGHCTIRKLYAI